VIDAQKAEELGKKIIDILAEAMPTESVGTILMGLAAANLAFLMTLPEPLQPEAASFYEASEELFTYLCEIEQLEFHSGGDE